MYNGTKIIFGLAIFVLAVASPFVFGLVGNTTQVRQLLDVPEGSCVKDAETMRASHMGLLDVWRDEVVREGKREEIEIDGKFYPKSLSLGCMACHTNKEAFCDKCHSYAGVQPYCWDCHVVPEEGQ